MGKKLWLFYALTTALLWGVWGAFIEIPEKAGFPATLGYSVWALTMIPGGIFALIKLKGQLDTDRRSVFLGLGAGLLGCGGQLILFEALRIGPAYLIFPFISIAPVSTIILSYIFLKERARRVAWYGIGAAVIAVFLLSYQPPGHSVVSGYLWILLSLLVAFMWSMQSFTLKFSNNLMRAESLVIYTVIASLLLIPVAILMTDFSQDINWSFEGPGLTAIIQFLNAIGFITLVFAFRYGKAIFVSPMVNAMPPVITVVLSLILYQVIPHPITISGMVLAVLAAFLMALEPDETTAQNSDKINSSKLIPNSEE
ncbi:MAG TPA: DMT family transporter [Caldithrix abyssi]|uniref:DMT family transporter n=1 Tax=Caldithrix abyssi TaxID=187145 RepID=A0A7V4UD70_CALAY|nr:DMT family transporter [Caldithrix abyssi]